MKVKLFIVFLFIFGCKSGLVKDSVTLIDNSMSPEVQLKKCDTTFFSSIKSANENPDCVFGFHLREKGFETFPVDVFNYPKLKSLDLSFNKIDSIPKEVGSLKQLEMLNLSYGTLSHIDPAIGDLESLKNLGLLYNKITAIPKEICLIENLEVLNLTGNEIDSLPKCICEMKSLKTLGLSYTKGMKHIDSLQYAMLKSCLPNTAIIFHEIN